MMGLARFVYAAFGVIVTPALRLWLRRRARRGKEDPARLRERFGHASHPRPPGTLVWMHAASVGELQSLMPVLHPLLQSNPQLQVLITTGTRTSAQLLAQQQLPRVLHQFIPVDTHAAVRRFLQHWHPDIALMVESEFWPQLLWQAQRRRIPMLLVNARISAKTQATWQRWPRVISSLLAGFTHIYAGSSADAARLRALGASHVHAIGNLKYDAAPLPVHATLLDELARACAGRPVFVAASTHAPEERMIAQAHAHVAQHIPQLLTVIVPRHATRGDAIATDLRAQGIHLAQRSKHEHITADTSLYLADTMGELGSFYRLADVVFMGGSLIAHGGQNPLEAARLSNAILTGPHTHNFTTIMDHLLQAQAMEVVADPTALAATLLRLLGDDAARLAMAERASDMVAQESGASAVIVQQLSALIMRVAP